VLRDFSHDISALALNTATLGHNLEGYGAGWSPEQVVDACAERGIGGIVFWQREVAARPSAIGEMVKSSGLQVVGLCRTPYLTGIEAPSSLDEAKRSIDIAAALGAPIITVVTGGTEPGTKGVLATQKVLSDRVAVLAEYAGCMGVKLALEPLNPMFGGNRTCLFTVADALSVCETVGSEYVGLAVDVYHVWWDNTLAATLNSCRGKIFGFHLCDWLENTSDMLLDRGMMGDGVADLKAIRSAVEKTGYRGFCEVEIFSANDWWARDPKQVLDKMISRFKKYC
jgi:sugar phosphate isomerase/epimerase